jgi:hypothetical protein
VSDSTATGYALTSQTKWALKVTYVRRLKNKNVRLTVRDRFSAPDIPVHMQEIKEFLKRIVKKESLDMGIRQSAREKRTRDPVYCTKQIFSVTHDKTRLAVFSTKDYEGKASKKAHKNILGEELPSGNRCPYLSWVRSGCFLDI